MTDERTLFDGGLVVRTLGRAMSGLRARARLSRVWSTISLGVSRSEPDAVGGNLIRFLWFDGVGFTPLWEAGPVLPEDERWLRHVVGLNDTLIGELGAWAEDRDAVRCTERASPDARSAVTAQADDLVTRLNAVLEPRFRTEHVSVSRATRAWRR